MHIADSRHLPPPCPSLAYNPEKNMMGAGGKRINLPGSLIQLFEDEKKAQVEIARAAVRDLVLRGKIPPSLGAEILKMRGEDFRALLEGEDLPLIDEG